MKKFFVTAALLALATPALANPTIRTYYTHNDSIAYGVEDDSDATSLTIAYFKPRQGMLDAGAKPADLLFQGTVDANGRTDGFSFAYKGACGRFPFKATGVSSADRKTIRLTGELPNVDKRCNITSYAHVELDFDVLFTPVP